MTHAIDCDLDEDCTCMLTDKPALEPGTYFDSQLDRYIHPDDPEWTAEGYERAAGEPWPFDEDEDE